MSIKTILLVCAQALLIQSISAQCIGTYGAYNGFAYDGIAYDGIYGAPFAGGACAGPYGVWEYEPAATLAASNGPGLAISSASSRVPAGVSVLSENAYAGELAVGGALPFLGTVALEGALPTAGAGAVRYGCGNGAVGIIAEESPAYGYAGIAEPFGYGYGTVGPLGYGYAGVVEPVEYGYGLAGSLGYRGGCGYGAFY